MSTKRLAVEILGLVLASASLLAKVLINALVGMEDGPRGGGPPALNFTSGPAMNAIGPGMNVSGPPFDADGPELNSSGPPNFPAGDMFSNPFEIEILPANWAFSIWGVIYSWQIIWVIYGWTFVFRPKTPRTIFTGVYYGYILICILNVTWIFVWNNGPIEATAAILVLYNIVFYPIIASLAFFLSRADGAKVYDIWLTRIIVLNGLLFHASWTTIASILNITLGLLYKGDVDGTDAAYIALSLLLSVVLTYFILENTVFDRYLRYAFAVYPVVIWALSAILANNWDVDNPSSINIFSLVLLVFTVILVLFRIIIFILFTLFRPLRAKSADTVV